MVHLLSVIIFDYSPGMIASLGQTGAQSAAIDAGVGSMW